MLDLLADFKSAILNMVKELKESRSKKTKGKEENISPNGEYQYRDRNYKMGPNRNFRVGKK